MEELLADGIYENDNGDFDYSQTIDLSDLTLTHFSNSDFDPNEVPVIGFEIANGAAILNYTVDFEDDAEGGVGFGTANNDFEGTSIELLGKSWYILEVDDSTNGVKMDLLDSATSTLLFDGETVTLTAGENTYEVSISYIDSSEVRITVNGQQTDSLAEDETDQLADGSYIGIKEIGFQGVDGIGYVEFSIGSGKLELEHGQEVKLNGDDLSELTDFEVNAYFTNTTEDLSEIKFEWMVDTSDGLFLAPGSSLTLPGLTALELIMTGFDVPSEEETTVTYDGEESFKLQTTVYDGDVSFNFLYTNTTAFTALGQEAAADQLITSSTSELIFDEDTDDWMVASWTDNADEAQTFVLQVDSIDDSDPEENTTVISSVATGSSTSVTLDIGETEDLGEMTLTLNAASEVTGVVNLTLGGTGTVEWDVLYTADGMKIQLPVISADSAAGALNTSQSEATWNMQFWEEDKDDNIAGGGNFNLTLGLNTAGEVTVTTLVGITDLRTEDDSDIYVGYLVSDLATRTLFSTGGDQDDIDIFYHGSEASANVYLAESGATTGSVAGGGLSIMDSELDGSDHAGMNLIIVGGSCVNTAAAQVLGVSSGTCGPAWTSETGAGAGEYVIETFTSPWASSKVATLVAGYEQADTQRAATYFTTQDPTTDVGTKYIGTTGTSATMVA